MLCDTRCLRLCGRTFGKGKTLFGSRDLHTRQGLVCLDVHNHTSIAACPPSKWHGTGSVVYAGTGGQQQHNSASTSCTATYKQTAGICNMLDTASSSSLSRTTHDHQHTKHANHMGTWSVHQERVTADGSLRVTRTATTNPSIAQRANVPTRPPTLPAAAPLAPPINPHQLSSLVDMIQRHTRVLVLTGAGCSTESNIPDYRGPNGAYTTGFTPMTHQQFMASSANRARYWARSFAGWHEFGHIKPNAAHEGLSRLQALSWVDNILTQNVDRLHHKAGSSAVLELHGTTHRVVCMQCGANSCRHEFQRQLAALNPEADAMLRSVAHAADAKDAFERALKAGTAADARKIRSGSKDVEKVPVRRPDGDVELHDAGVGFDVPACGRCGGILKPDVVFFGDSVPKTRADRAMDLAVNCDMLLVVGSSLMVWSAYRLAKAAKQAGATIAMVNVGATRADDIADMKVPVLAGEAMLKLASHPNLLIPRI
eukprot:jgi/Chrzof1/11107/Cz05g24020.t1